MASKHFFRSSVARSMYERMLKDQYLRTLDKSQGMLKWQSSFNVRRRKNVVYPQWYKCDLTLVSENLRSLHMPSSSDPETEDFLEMCFEKSDWLFTQIFHAFAKVFLCWFMTRTSINGLLGRGSMFVFSTLHFQSLIGIDTCNDRTGKTLLDLGAGDGNVTDKMAKHFEHIHVTEISSVMGNILSRKGYKIQDVNSWGDEPTMYDVISCLNLIDRCDKPLELLKTIRKKLKPGSGKLLLAVVLPFSQYVETGYNNHQPIEKMSVKGSSFEEQLSSLANGVLSQAGFEVIRWTRLPYLCEGDLNQSFYWLDDAVLVLGVKEESATEYCDAL